METIGVSTACFSASFPRLRRDPLGSAERLLKPDLELLATQRAVRKLSLAGIELAYRRGVGVGRVYLRVLTIHGPVFASFKDGWEQARTTKSLVHRAIGLFIPLLFGWDFRRTDELARHFRAFHIIHAGTAIKLRERRDRLLSRQRSQWLIEADWAEWKGGRPPERGVWKPEEVISLADRLGMGILLDTSRAQIMGLSLGKTLEAYGDRVKALHISGAVAGQSEDGGLALFPEAATERNRRPYERSLAEIRELLESIRDRDLPLIIELSFTTRRMGPKEGVRRSVEFIRDALANIGQV